MGNDYIISIEKEARLSIDTERLKIFIPLDDKTHYIAVMDIAVLILANPCISLTAPVIQYLSKRGAVILSVDDKFMPSALTLAVGYNIDGAKRPHQQAKLINTEYENEYLDQIIKSKILGQEKVLRLLKKEKADYLLEILKRVKVGDKENIEGLAAKIYWKEYFKAFHSSEKREKQGANDIINSCLNYGYAVLRAIIARSLCSAGLCLNFGLGHYRKDNPFNLAEDFIEPFRYIVDSVVLKILKIKNDKELSSSLKKEIILNILNFNVKMGVKNYRLFHAVDEAVYSFCSGLTDTRKNLVLPNSYILRGVKRNKISPQHIKYES